MIGMATVVIARIRSPVSVEFAAFVVDVFCLGVKNALYESDATEGEFRDFLGGSLMQNCKQPFQPACARKLIEGAVAYAERHGFAPHRDYRKARKIFSGILASTCEDDFRYGKDGRPFYVRGPDDSDARVDRILAILEGKYGPEGFAYIDSQEVPERDDARVELMEWLRDQPESVPDFYEISGMITAMQLAPKILTPTLLLKRLGLGDSQSSGVGGIEGTVIILMEYWNAVADRIAAVVGAPNADDAICIDIYEEDFEKGDLVAVAMAMRSWASGFIQATELWPEAWGDALSRPDLSLQWEMVRRTSALETKENTDRIEKMIRDGATGGIFWAVNAIARTLRTTEPR